MTTLSIHWLPIFTSIIIAAIGLVAFFIISIQFIKKRIKFKFFVSVEYILKFSSYKGGAGIVFIVFTDCITHWQYHIYLYASIKRQKSLLSLTDINSSFFQYNSIYFFFYSEKFKVLIFTILIYCCILRKFK